ncbi:hypothetical protein WN944_019384 [Citrus x changshan-huyou]|uniref:Uncharacterized protein n=1 Tax=Citrus x changshan-huyou TaxID=2935761 RepID=A0AAP0QF32_9ROSI
MELKEDLKKAFYKDMAEKNPSGLSSSSPKEGVKCKGRKRFSLNVVLDSFMENANEMSASLSFVSSRQSSNPEEPLLDAEIVVEGKSVAVNHCILSAHSQFLHWLFNLRNDGSVSEGKPKYLMTDLVPYGKVGYEAFNDILHYLYTGKLKPSPLVVSTCVDDACAHDACPPAVNYAIELMYAFCCFSDERTRFAFAGNCASLLFVLLKFMLLGIVLTFMELKSISIVTCKEPKQLLNFVEKAFVEDVIPILVAALHCHLNQLRSLCIQRVVRSNLDNIYLEKELPEEVSSEIKSIRIKFHQESEDNAAEVDPVHAKRVRRIHKALDSDDFELLNLLLNEYEVTLDDAYALHYAAAYCSPDVFVEVLNMGLADLNLKDARGHTVLHVAARRKEPAVLLALLSKGACASETKSDGQTAVAICRRMTRRKDYIEASKLGQEINKDRLCIDVLDNFMSGNLTMQSEVMDDDFQMQLNYLGNRVERGRRYFPHCSEVVDKFLDCDWPDASLLESDALEEQKLKRARLIELEEDVQLAFCKDMAYDNRSGLPSSSKWYSRRVETQRARFMELKEDLQKGFYKDMAEKNRSALSSSSSSSSSPKEGVKCKGRKR